MSTFLIIVLALLVNTLVLSRVAQTLPGNAERQPVRRQATEYTTDPQVVDSVTSRHVALHP